MHCRIIRWDTNQIVTRLYCFKVPLQFPSGSNTNWVWSLGWWYWYTRPYRASSLRFDIGYLPHSSAAVALRPSLLGKYKQDFLALAADDSIMLENNFESSKLWNFWQCYQGGWLQGACLGLIPLCFYFLPSKAKLSGIISFVLGGHSWWMKLKQTPSNDLKSITRMTEPYPTTTTPYLGTRKRCCSFGRECGGCSDVAILRTERFQTANCESYRSFLDW